MARHNIPTHHPQTNSGPAKPPPSSSSPSGGSNSNSTPGGGGPKADPNSASSIYAQQKKDQKKAQHKSAQNAIQDAQRLSLQAHALRLALGKKGFTRSLNQLLANQDMWTRTADRDLMLGFHDRLGSLKNAEADNEKAAGAQTYANLANRGRERANAVGEAMANGAGESDMLRAQQMSLNNWNANQNEVNRSFYDSRSSINSSLTDLNVDTRTARKNNVQAGNAAKSQLWTTYYNQRSETLTQLGNTLGQMADYYSNANEMESTKKTRHQEHRLSRLSGNAFDRAADVAGQAWHDPGVPKRIRKWDGAADFEGRLNNSKFASASTELTEKKPEGASLRSWT